MSTSAAPDKLTPRTLWQDSPGAFKGGVVVGIIAWFVSINEYSTVTENGTLTSCTYLDYGKIALGAIAVICGVAGWLGTRRSHRPLPTVVATLIAAALVVDGVLLVLKGLDIVAGVCPAL